MPNTDEPQPRILHTFSDYNACVLAFRDLLAMRQVAIRGDSVAEVSGLTVGYIGKLLGPGRVRRIGWASLFALCGAGGVKLALVEDPEAIAKYGRRIEVRTGYNVRVLAVNNGRGKTKLVSVKFLQSIASSGGKARAAKLSKRRRRQIAKIGAAAARAQRLVIQSSSNETPCQSAAR